MADRQLIEIVPTFVVADVDVSIAHYVDKLGFRTNGVWHNDDAVAVFAIVARDGARLMLARTDRGAAAPNKASREVWDAYVYVTDVAALESEFRANGAEIARGPEDTFYDCREIDVTDPDGFVVCFAQDLDPD